MIAHPIPDAALEADIATLAQKGAGKTYLNKGLVERLLDLKRRVVILDPLSIWWGLKALADGSPGYPVVVVGGPNADVPLDPAKGVELAAYVAGADVRMVIDVSDLRSGELVRFSAAFFAEVYRLNRDPLWLVLEEADVFAPQNPQPNETMMLHEVDRIVRRGRQRGFRVWTITQRPQEINKKVLSQTPVMVLMRLMSPQDREAAKHWLLSHADKAQAAEILTQLSSLAVGEGYILAPTLGLLQRANFPPIRTLDNSATPKAGEERVGVKALAKVDAAALAKALAHVEPAPAAVESHATPASAAVASRMRQEMEAAEARGFERGLVEGERRAWVVARTTVSADIDRRLDETLKTFRAEMKDLGIPETMFISAPSFVEAKMNMPAKSAPSPRPPAFGEFPGKVSRAVTDIITFYEAISPRAVPFMVAAKQAGVGLKSSQFRTYEPELRASGRVEDTGGGRYRATNQVGSPADYLARVEQQLAPAHQRIFRFIRDASRPVSKDEIIVGAEISPTSSTTTAALSLLLNEAEVIERTGDGYRLAGAYRPEVS